MQFCHLRVGPLMARISAGGNNCVRQRSTGTHVVVSWYQLVCLDSGTRAATLASPGLKGNDNFAVTHRFTLPIVTFTVILRKHTAGLDGLRALQANSVTRGRPPVISPLPPTARGMLHGTSPAFTFCPFSTTT